MATEIIPGILEDSSDTVGKPLAITRSGKILLGVTGALAVGLTVISIPFVSPALRRYCLPYIPATPAQIENILKALQGRSGTIIDLGSGDGRIVLELAKLQNLTKCVGVELNPWLVLYSKIQALRSGFNSKVEFYKRDLWKFQLNSYDNIVIFGVEQMMADLEKKFERECRKDCNIIACRFPLPNRKPIRTIGVGVDTVWIYEMKR